MPCWCAPDDKELNDAQVKIREHAEEICRIIGSVTHPTSRYPEMLKDSMKLLEHIYTGECDEKI
jgi:hypothetical protein